MCPPTRAASSPACWRPTPRSGPGWTSCCGMTSSHRCVGSSGVARPRGAGQPAPGAHPGARLQRASPRTGCRPAPATAHPSLPCPSLCAGSSGRWASCCWPSAGPPVSTAPAPLPCSRPPAPAPAWPWVLSTPLHLPICGRGGCGWQIPPCCPGAGLCPPKLLALPQAPALLTRPRIQEEVVQIVTPRSGAVR